MATRLENLSRAPKTYILHTAGEASERLPKFKTTVVVEKHDPKTGARSTAPLKRQFPASITLQPKGCEGDSIEGLPDAVILVSQIANDVKAGVIRAEVEHGVEPTPAPSGDQPQSSGEGSGSSSDTPSTPTVAPTTPDASSAESKPPDPAPTAPPVTTRKGRKED